MSTEYLINDSKEMTVSMSIQAMTQFLTNINKLTVKVTKNEKRPYISAS